MVSRRSHTSVGPRGYSMGLKRDLAHVSMLMPKQFSAFTQSFAGLVACRLLLGLFEAGLFPGLVVYLTICKPCHTLAQYAR